MPGETRERLLDEAIGAFRAMLIEEPRLLRVRLELARAFYLKGEDDLARRHFEIVLAAEPPEAVVANVTGFLSSIRARRRWSFNLGAALAPDSNIGGTSEERIIYIFDLPFRRNVEELTTSGIGVSLWGGAEYHYPVLDDLRIRAGAQFARREYERSRFDQLFIGTHLGPRWLIDRDTELSVLGSARQRWVGTAPDDRELGGRLEVGHRISQHVTVAGQASWHGRRYRVRRSLDGPLLDASVRASWVVDPTVRLEFSGGYGRHRPKRFNQRNRARWLGTGVSVILPLGFTVGAGAEVRWTDYERGWFPFVRGRRCAQGPHQELPRLRPPPGLHPLRLQPGAGGGGRGARDQRPAPRLRAHPRRASLRAAVLAPTPSAFLGGRVQGEVGVYREVTRSPASPRPSPRPASPTASGAAR